MRQTTPNTMQAAIDRFGGIETFTMQTRRSRSGLVAGLRDLCGRSTENPEICDSAVNHGYFASGFLPEINTSLRGNFSNTAAGSLKLVASTSTGLAAIHSDRSISS